MTVLHKWLPGGPCRTHRDDPQALAEALVAAAAEDGDGYRDDATALVLLRRPSWKTPPPGPRVAGRRRTAPHRGHLRTRRARRDLVPPRSRRLARLTALNRRLCV
ncbi:hypothetical protein GCM10009864_59890 [Streptomyces lunalinharesii]|uniref:PPM-type phosphatase domain-containing protein n=1 Tax=Streptomyces lunalinharesii TaxID=333384 RepID=A0ABP6F0R9_9ACTN